MPTTTLEQDKKAAADMLALLSALRAWAEGLKQLKIVEQSDHDSLTKTTTYKLVDMK